MSSFGILFVRRKRLFLRKSLRSPTNLLRRLVGLGLLGKHNPPNLRRTKACWSRMPMSYPMSLCRYFIRKKRLVEDLSRLLNDIRYGSFIIVGLPGKLPKASGLRPIFFQQKKKRENKGHNLTKMVWNQKIKCQTRSPMVVFLTMSFFSKRGKKTC